MGNDELLTVSEYAAAAGISTQAVYKQVAKNATNHLKVKNRIYIYKSELEKRQNSQLFNQPNNQPVDNFATNSTNQTEPLFTASQSNYIEMLQSQNTFLQDQIREKDEQIRALSRQVEQAQQLQAISMKKLEELEKAAEPPAETQQAQPQTVPTKEEPHRKRWQFWK